MRARNVILALLIIIVGLGITATRQGAFAHWSQTIRDLVETVDSLAAEYDDGGSWREVDRISRRVPIARATSLTIENPNGAVSVVGQQQDFVQVEAVRYGRGADAERAKANAQSLTLDIMPGDDVLAVRATPSQYRHRAARMDLRLTAPADLHVTVHSASGALNVRAMARTVNARTMSGDITIADAAEARANSASGEVRLRQIAGSVEGNVVSGDLYLDDVVGQVKAHAISGDIEATNVRDALSASTVSGSMKVRNYTGANATVSTTSGDVEAELTKPFAGHLVGRSVSGDISIALPRDSGCAVELASVSGDLRASLPLCDKVQARGRLSGILGSGQGRVELHSMSGNLSLRESPVTRPGGAPRL
jgi:DUF4097 and DUF4098 domain-containing protein YvlB